MTSATMTTAFKQHGKVDTRSQLKKSLDENEAVGEIGVNACPFGCGNEETDKFGFCRHLIGFTNARLPEGEVKNPKEAEVEVLADHDSTRDIMGRRVMTALRLPLLAGDHLVRITCTSRVYRKEPLKVPSSETPQKTRATAPAVNQESMMNVLVGALLKANKDTMTQVQAEAQAAEKLPPTKTPAPKG